MLAHGAVLRKNFFSAEQLEAIAKDFRHAGLEEKEVLMMEYAQKVVRDAASSTQDDFDRLRKAGWTDEDILSITLAAAARSFVSKVFDALGADADAIYKELDEETHHTLIGKRPFSV
jgi:alkylhydroperoxidase family enzyme